MEGNSRIQNLQKKQKLLIKKKKNHQKKQKLNEEQDTDGNNKCLSNLPEAVLLDILSPLPTKDAARTSLLSKRWKYLWASIPNLVFDGSFPAMRTICFSYLEILTIKHVTFSDEYLTQQLFSGTPVLKKLDILYCSWGDLKVVTISAPKLHSLRIHECREKKSRNGDVCQVMIFAESLKEFYYSGIFSNYRLYKSFSLVKAWISTFPKPSEKIAHCMYKLLTGFSNVQFLTLPCALVKAMIYAAELVPRMPMFNNLVDLEFLSPWSIDLDCAALWTLLQKSPCLKALKFSGGISREKVDGILNPVPPCFLSHLKCIEVAEYRGEENELSAVKILLENAIALDKIVITCPKLYARYKEGQEKICKQLKELRGRSQNCKIVLECASEILL